MINFILNTPFIQTRNRIKLKYVIVQVLDNLKFHGAILNFLHIRSSRSDGKMQFMRLGRALATPAHTRDPRAQQAFMRIGRSAPGSKPSMYTRIGRAPAPAGVYTRIGRSADDADEEEDDIYARDTRSPADMYTRLGRAPQLYTRIGRAAPNKQQMYMRIGKAGAASQFTRIGRAANKQFMRIGRAGASRQFTRLGRAAKQQFMRIGRAPQLYTRIGKRSYFRTGRASHLYTRLV